MSSPSSTGQVSLSCHICRARLEVTLARGRKSGKSFVALKCPSDGRHFRGFVADREFVGRLLKRLESEG